MNFVIRAMLLCISISTAWPVFAQNGHDYEPEEVAEECYRDFVNSGTKFGEDGHLYTTYLIARFAGVPPSYAYTLAYYSEYPDIDSKYKAGPGLSSWKRRVNENLHSLHGGKKIAVEARRDSLEKGIDRFLYKEQVVWKSGVLLHALADAYAHTKYPLEDPRQKAYGYVIGHVFNGFKPDQIAQPEVFPKYAAYVEVLFDLVKIEGHANDEMLEEFLNVLKEFVCEKTCTSAERKQMKNRIYEFALDDGTFWKDWYRCIKENARPIRRNEMESVINVITSQEKSLNGS